MEKRDKRIGRNLTAFIEGLKFSGMSPEEETAYLHSLRYILKDIERGTADPQLMICEIDLALEKRKEQKGKGD